MRVALAHHQPHPETTFRHDAWLRLIAHRLGLIARALSPEADIGEELVPLSTAFLEELLRYKIQDAKDLDELTDGDEGEDV